MKMAKSRSKAEAKGRRAMPSFKSQSEKALWLTQARRPKQRLCWIPSFSRAEEKKKRMRKLAKEILESKTLIAGSQWERERLGNLEVLAKKLARMVLR